ncbi:hypothetical protein BKA67DRAFT_406941 [Truncatella angustata]|uniref:Uncharacterized protein n=1 Tax=Truncatella angustata TaxID=152316 RepID=A0A9P8UDW3_9PEZI|nr:uncharacterized protein BKA67DRAFT_406941 [Truncatella angustata]KAH6648125.1 hypothetical protein BKA67DRAFT_406941 [Truncatella angustata]
MIAREDHRNPSDLLRALLLVNEFIQLQQGENLVQDTNAVRAHTLSHLSRSTIMLGRTTQTYGSTICDVEATSCGAERQIKTYVFCMLCLQTLLVGTEVTVAVDSSQVLLARCVSNCTWSRFSDDADETRCRCPEVPTLYEALRILGNSTTSPNDLPWLRNATNIYIIVIHILYSSHMLTQLRQSMVLDPRIVLQDTTKPFIAAVNQCSLALQDLRVVSDRDCVKTASLSNVDALVSLVRLRQVFDLDILSILRLKDPLQSAELALSFPGPQRSLQLIPTLERCATIMETPAKMGIMLYARTQLNLWSLEQTLATFECTLFLSKWLEIFSLSLDESPATREFPQCLVWLPRAG